MEKIRKMLDEIDMSALRPDSREAGIVMCHKYGLNCMSKFRKANDVVPKTVPQERRLQVCTKFIRLKRKVAKNFFPFR